MKTAMLIVTVLCIGCSDGMSLARPDAGSAPDVGAETDAEEPMADAKTGPYCPQVDCYQCVATRGCIYTSPMPTSRTVRPEEAIVYVDGKELPVGSWTATVDYLIVPDACGGVDDGQMHVVAVGAPGCPETPK